MHRVILLKIGGKRLHLLKLIGGLVVVGAALGALNSVASIFRVLKQADLAKTSADVALHAFGVTSSAVSNDVVLGLVLAPIAFFLLWLALFVVGAMVYRSSGLILPIEEDIEDKKD